MLSVFVGLDAPPVVDIDPDDTVNRPSEMVHAIDPPCTGSAPARSTRTVPKSDALTGSATIRFPGVASLVASRPDVRRSVPSMNDGDPIAGTGNDGATVPPTERDT